MHPANCLCPMCYAARFETPEVRKTITYPQPTMAEAMQQALAVVEKKYFISDKESQDLSMIIPVSDSLSPWTPIINNRDVPVRISYRGCVYQMGPRQEVEVGHIATMCKPEEKQWARDVWIDEHEAQLAGANKPDIDQINDLLSEISDSDRRIQAMQQAEAAAIAAAFDHIWKNFRAPEPENKNAYYDRIKLEAHQARLDRNNSYESRFDTKPWIEKELAVIDTQQAMAKAMQQPTQTELSMNDQVLSARYGRNDG